MIQPIARPTIAERRAAVQAALAESPEWSDRRLSAALNVSRDMVRTERLLSETDGSIPVVQRIRGRDGKEYAACKLGVCKPRTMSVDAMARCLERVARDLAEKLPWAPYEDRVRFREALRAIREVAE